MLAYSILSLHTQQSTARPTRLKAFLPLSYLILLPHHHTPSPALAYCILPYNALFIPISPRPTPPDPILHYPSQPYHISSYPLLSPQTYPSLFRLTLFNTVAYNGFAWLSLAYLGLS